MMNLDNESISILYQDSVSSPLETSNSYPSSLPARGLVPEPHYSVPQNNTRVKIAGEEESKTQTKDDGLVTQVRKEVKFVFAFSKLTYYIYIYI